MELLSEELLEHLQTFGAFSELEALRIFEQIALALDHMHSKMIYHGGNFFDFKNNLQRYQIG
jgi:hypothetical protein